MPRSSRHKSKKQHKHSSNDALSYTDSEEDERFKARVVREEPLDSSGVRVSKASESGEKRKVKELLNPGCNGDYSEERGTSKRRKDRADSILVPERWRGGEVERVEGLDGEKDTRGESFGLDSEMALKLKAPADSKSKTSRRRESGSESKVEALVTSVKHEEPTRRSGKLDSSRRSEKNSSSADVKGEEHRTERGKKVQDGRSERSVDIVGTTSGESDANRKKGARVVDKKGHVPREGENTERQVRGKLDNPDLEKGREKCITRSDGLGENMVRDDENDDTHCSSKEDRQAKGKLEDGRHKDDNCKDRRQEDLEKDIRYKDNKHSLKEHTRAKSDKHIRDDTKSSENSHKKARLQDKDRDGSGHVDDTGVRCKYIGEKSPVEQDHNDFKPCSAKKQQADVGKNASTSSKVDSSYKRSESHYHNIDAVDSLPSNSRKKSSPRSSVHVEKNQRRHIQKPEESLYGDSLFEEQHRHISKRDVPEKACVSPARERPRQKAGSNSGEVPEESATGPPWYSKSPKFVPQVSPVRLTEKSPSSTSGDKQYSNRSGVRRNLEVEETGRRRSGSKDLRDYSTNDDRVHEFPFKKPVADDFSQAERLHRESTPVGSFFSRTGPISSSPNALLPPPFKHGTRSPSVMYTEDDSRGQAGDQNFSNRYKRDVDSRGMGRGQGNNTWRGITNWSSPVTNGFIPFQHGQPHNGFHPVIQQFPPPLFGGRPSMELNHIGVPWHDPGHSFGWQNSADGSIHPHLRGWDGGNGVFGEESHTYGRPDWDPSTQLSSHGWNANTDLWKAQNGDVKMELTVPQKELDYFGQVSTDETRGGRQYSQQACNEWSQPEHVPAESIEIKQSNNSSSGNKTAEGPPIIVQEKMPEASKPSELDGTTMFCRAYLSKLDISRDLVCSELYKQVMNLMGLEGDTIDAGNDTHKNLEREDAEVRAKGCNFDLGAVLFPASTETVFERSMALYQKQKREMKVKLSLSSSVVGTELAKIHPTTVNEGAAPIRDLSEHAVKVTDLHINKDNTVSQGHPSSIVKEQQFDTISKDVLSDSRACEALMPESLGCRVTLSRIHNSPKSTH